MRSWRDGAISIGIALGVLAAMELALRSAGFHHEIAPMSLRFGYPNPREIVDVFTPDPMLFWRMKPGSTFDAESPVAINASGYRGPMPSAASTPGRMRVAVMGDSVAFGASTAFPEMLGARLSAEVLNFGVPGYTIVQGLRQFDAEVAGLRPDVVVIAYGWNDHWLAKDHLTDDARRPSDGAVARIARLVARLRLAQGLRFAIDKHMHGRSSRKDAPARVPLPTFRAQLDTFLEHVKRAGAVPVVVALPSALATGEFPEYLVASGFTRSAEEAIAAHRDYAAEAGAAAGAAGAAFVDLQPSFESSGQAELGLFRADKIHMTDLGNERIVEALAPVVEPTRP